MGERFFLFQCLVVVKPLPDDMIRVLLPHQFQPSFGSGILLFDDAPVTAVTVQLHQQMGMGHGPSHAAVLDAHRGRGIGKHAVRQGAVMPVPSGFGIESFHVVVEHEGVGGGDQVAAVSETFAVGAVRLHAEQVAKERPLTHRLDAVELIVGTREESHRFHGGVHAKALDVLQRRPGRKAGEFDVSEGMEREAGRVGFRATAPSNVGIGLPGDGGRPVRAPSSCA